MIAAPDVGIKQKHKLEIRRINYLKPIGEEKIHGQVQRQVVGLNNHATI